MASRGVTVIWKCSRPGRKYPGLAQFTENAAIQAAQMIHRDVVYIRHHPHRTTRVGGRTVQMQNHITANFYYRDVNSNNPEDVIERGALQGHVFVDDQNTRLLNVSEVTERPQRNPQLWDIRRKSRLSSFFGFLFGRRK